MFQTQNLCPGSKNVFDSMAQTFFVSEQQNLFPQHMFPARLNWETFASAAMFPQQCFLVEPGLNVCARWKLDSKVSFNSNLQTATTGLVPGNLVHIFLCQTTWNNREMISEARYIFRWCSRCRRRVLAMVTETARKTSLKNKQLRNYDFFAIIPSCSHFRMLTKSPETGLVWALSK